MVTVCCQVAEDMFLEVNFQWLQWMGGGVQTADDDVAAAPDTEELVVRTACRRRPTECFAPKEAMISEIKLTKNVF